MNWEPGEFTIRHENSREQIVVGIKNSLFGVNWTGVSSSYAVTHLATGYRVGPVIYNLGRAVAFANLLAQMPDANWHLEQPHVTKEAVLSIHEVARGTFPPIS